MKNFVSDLAGKMMISLGLPIAQKHYSDRELHLCINTYGSRELHNRREKAHLLTFLVLMDCHNTYETALEKVNNLASDTGYKSVKPKKISTIKTYRSNIVHKYLSFNEDELPSCAHDWKIRIIKELDNDL